MSALDFQTFNTGDYYRAVEAKIQSENIIKVLYPNDEQLSSKILRLTPQSASSAGTTRIDTRG